MVCIYLGLLFLSLGRSWKYNGEQNSWFLPSQNLKFSEEDKTKQATVKSGECPGREVKRVLLETKQGPSAEARRVGTCVGVNWW